MAAQSALASAVDSYGAEDSRVRFVLQLGKALHRYGTPAHRLEEVMVAVSGQLGLTARFFTSPTAIFASFGEVDALCATLIRADPGELDLERLSRLDALTIDVLDRRKTLEQGAEGI
ncbi:MAG: threonine/serine exporter family protein, partial [Myxococcales bacterium]